MKFEELASRAGKRASAAGRRSARPSIADVIAVRQRRSLIVGWSTATATIVLVAGLGLLWSAPNPSAPVAAAPTTTTRPTTTAIEDPGYVPTLLLGDMDECPVTIPGEMAFIPEAVTPDAPPAEYNSVWHGSSQLWTRVGHEGEIWSGLPVASDGTFTQKTFWWSADIDDMTETPDPDITVTAELLNAAESRSFQGGRATSGSRPDLGVFRIVGVQIPQEGCWEITSSFREANVSYVTWVGNE
jgi:hypothetical protein